MHYVPPVQAVVAVDRKTLTLLAIIALWLKADAAKAPAR